MKTTKTILIFSANPKDTSRLRLDEEVREIRESLQRSKNRDYFIVQQQWAVRLIDLRRTILDYEPDIIHFCGHGDEDGLMVEDELGHAILVAPDALAGLFELFKNKIECVFLNACYSRKQAEAITTHINYVIGMNTSVQDKTAIEFAIGFYDALGSGKSIEEAFKFGCNAIQFRNMPNHLLPILEKNSCEQNSILPSNPLSQNDNFREQYEILNQQLHRLKMDKIIETDTLTRFKFEKQIERIENEIRELENNFP